jgi:hypothetical protein
MREPWLGEIALVASSYEPPGPSRSDLNDNGPYVSMWSLGWVGDNLFRNAQSIQPKPT